MKKNALFIMTLLGLSFCALSSADCIGDVERQELSESSSLSADEQAFAAKLSDQNRRAFCQLCSREQRGAIMVAFASGSNADEAVHRMLAAQEMKERNAVAVGDDQE